MDKPAGMFDRDFEWAELSRYVGFQEPRATLGVVSGRRRQGKTYLLDAMAGATGGFMFTATEATEALGLRLFGRALARYCREPVPFRFVDWDEAIARLMLVATSGPTVVVIDEFPHLANAAPSLPSIIQKYLDPTAQHTNTPVRLLLCGSALSFMGKLLSGNAPLRGRAGLEMVVPTFDFRLAAEFWDIEDPRLALLTNAVVGGTPAYRREFAVNDSPRNLADFDPWVVRAVLSPTRPLFREARYLLAEEPELHDTALYHTVLAAIAAGNSTRGGIANCLMRKASDLAHSLAVLEDVGMITHDPDVFRGNRSQYRIAEPLLTFYHSIVEPAWGELERPGRADGVWQYSQRTFTSKVVGPHFERVCREWARWYADPETFGGYATAVGSGVVNDPTRRTHHEVDVAVLGQDEDGRRVVRSIGEAKWNTTMTLGHLDRLRRIRDLLRDHPKAPAEPDTKLSLYSGSGFADDLREAAAECGDIVLVDLPRLYAGS
ncbi:MAG TPA: ATPase [Pseudonocardiaceae bacterium]|nr:ATPase [Pseudonocardiaceae bacterium]